MTTTTLPDLYGPAYGAPTPALDEKLSARLTTAGVKHGHAVAEIPGTWVRIYLPGGNDDADPDPYVLDSYRVWTYCGRENVEDTTRLAWDGWEFSADCLACGRSFTGAQDVTR